ncbi:MAG: B12-binding domain-containing radical SAM protein, partial [Spirochaetes bacterium]|nr:B12-binding domain-containing radical SAM protein [Spirochaetota bacterium]
ITVYLRDGGLYSDYKEFQQEIIKIKPDFFGVSIPSALYSRAKQCIKFVRENLPETKIIIGGPHPTIFPEEVMKELPIDYLVRSEGELTLEELFQALKKKKDLKTITGLSYRDKNNKTVHNAERVFCNNLSSLPWPARELLEMDKYLVRRPLLPLPYPSSYVIASRGCPGNCNFCQPSNRMMVGRRVRSRDVKDVVDEIEHLVKKYKVAGINLGADYPIANKIWTKAFCEELIKRKVKVKINAPTRIEAIDDDILIYLKKAGFIQLTFGIESGSQKILKIMRKGIKIDNAIKIFKNCTRRRIQTKANLMVGTLGETKETIGETWTFIKKAHPDLITMSMTTPYPGTDLYYQAQKENLLIGERKDIIHTAVGYLKLKNLTVDEIKKFSNQIIFKFRLIFLSYFLNPFILIKKYFLIPNFIKYFISLIKNVKLLFNTFKYLIFYQHYKIFDSKKLKEKLEDIGKRDDDKEKIF